MKMTLKIIRPLVSDKQKSLVEDNIGKRRRDN